MTRARSVTVLAGATFLAGCTISFAVDLLLFMVDDTCPQWEDEGSMAAPHSPYSLIMCEPGAEPPFVWAWYVGIALAAGLVLWALRRRGDRLARALPWLTVALVGPSVLIGLLHVTLPRDCASGRTETGVCSRDRELR